MIGWVRNSTQHPTLVQSMQMFLDRTQTTLDPIGHLDLKAVITDEKLYQNYKIQILKVKGQEINNPWWTQRFHLTAKMIKILSCLRSVR